MKTQIILFVVFIFSFSAFAQKLTKEEKEQEKICKEYTITTVDAFTNKNVVSTKFDEAFGFVINHIRVGVNIWIGAKEEVDEVYLLLKLGLNGTNINEIPEGEVTQFSLYDESSKEIIELNTSGKTNPATSSVSSKWGGSTTTYYEIKYKLTHEQLNSFKTKLLKALKLNLGGVEIVAEVDNEDRTKTFQKAVKCFGK